MHIDPYLSIAAYIIHIVKASGAFYMSS